MDTVGPASRPLSRLAQNLNWIMQAIRAPFLTVALMPALLGGAAAWMKGEVRPLQLVMAILSVLLLHAGANLWNDYQDELSGSDRLQSAPTPYSGGSRVIQDGIFTSVQVGRWALICFAGGGLCGIVACLGGSPLSVGFLAVGLLIGWGYSAPPLRWIGRGWGEIAVGLAFGPLLTGGVYLTQTVRISPAPFLASTALGLLVAAVLCVNEIPDMSTDGATAKRTLAVRLNPAYFETIIICIITLAYLITFVGWVRGVLPRMTFIAFLTLPLAIRIGLYISRIAQGDLEANRRLIQLTALFGFALILAFTVGRWTG